MMAALVAGERNPKVLAQLARRRMRAKIGVLEEALTGHFTDHHAFLLADAGPGEVGDRMAGPRPQHEHLSVFEADDRPSSTSQPQSRTKRKQSRRRNTNDHDAPTADAGHRRTSQRT